MAEQQQDDRGAGRRPPLPGRQLAVQRAACCRPSTHLRAGARALRSGADRTSPCLLRRTDPGVSRLAFHGADCCCFGLSGPGAGAQPRGARRCVRAGPCLHDEPALVPDLLAPSDPRRAASRRGAGHGADRIDRGARSIRLVGERDDLPRLGGGRRGATETRDRRAAPRLGGEAKPSASSSTHPCFLGLLAGLYIGIRTSGEALQLLDEALARVERTRGALVRGGAASAQGRGAAGALARATPPKPKPASAGPGCRPRPGRAICGSCAPRPASPGCGATGQARRGPRPARAGLRLVHRGLRYRRSEGRQGAARRAGVAPRQGN